MTLRPFGYVILRGMDEVAFFSYPYRYVESRFKGITTIAIECNHVEGILSETSSPARYRKP
jgi:hypothetical protein